MWLMVEHMALDNAATIKWRMHQRLATPSCDEEDIAFLTKVLVSCTCSHTLLSGRDILRVSLLFVAPSMC